MKYTKALTAGGSALFAALLPAIAFAQTASTTPGAPSTGVGGEAMFNTLILVASAIVALIGAGYLSRQVGSKA